MIPTRVQDNMTGATSSVEGVLADFLTPILTNIDGEATIEGLIDLHKFISANTTSMVLNLGGGLHGNLALSMTAEENMEQTGFVFVLPHKPGDYPQSMGGAQEQVLKTIKFPQNQAMFFKYTAVDRSLKNKIVTAVEPVFLYPLVDQLTGFGQVTALTMLQNLLFSCGAIN